MDDLLVKKLTAEDFDAEKYIQGVSNSSGGGLELQQQRQRIQQLAKETNSLLKKNVYQNYMQFIETAKEISYLESEMYQLSHLITEQKSLLGSVLELSVSGERGPGTAGSMPEPNSTEQTADPQLDRIKMEKHNRKRLTTLLENIEGCSHILEEEHRWLVHQGDLVELSQEDYTGQQRVRACLLNDSFMLATWLAHRRGPIRYRFSTLHLLDTLVPVNIKDRGQTTNAFKLLIFPEARVFQAPSAEAKAEWLLQIEKTKHEQAAQQQQQQPEKSEVGENSSDKTAEDSELNQNDDEDLSNPFGRWGQLNAPPAPSVPQIPAWVQELPEDLDQAIAQRKFEDSLTLIQRGKEYFSGGALKTPLAVELKRALETRVSSLETAMKAELKMAETRSLNAGPKVARRAATVLISLQRHQLASELFLQYRSKVLRSALHNLRLEGQTSTFVRHLCSVYFKHLRHTIEEYRKVFSSCQQSCVPALVVWASSSMSMFAGRFSQHVFSTQSTLSTISHCLSIACHSCDEVSSTGLDLRCVLLASISRELERRIVSSRDKMVDAIKLRAQDDSWEQSTFSDARKLTLFIEEMNDMGVGGLTDYVTGERELGLTSNLIELTRALICYLEDVVRIVAVWQDASYLLGECLTAVLECQLQHCLSAYRHPMLQEKAPVISLNCLFVLDVLLPLTEQRYSETAGASHPSLAPLNKYRQEIQGEDFL